MVSFSFFLHLLKTSNLFYFVDCFTKIYLSQLISNKEIDDFAQKYTLECMSIKLNLKNKDGINSTYTIFNL